MPPGANSPIRATRFMPISAPRRALPASRPPHLKSVVSLRSFITATVNPKSERVAGRDARCRAAAGGGRDAGEASGPGGAPLSGHALSRRLHPSRRPRAEGGGARQQYPALEVRAGEAVTPLIADNARLASAAWDVSIDEIPVDGDDPRRWLCRLGRPPAWSRKVGSRPIICCDRRSLRADDAQARRRCLPAARRGRGARPDGAGQRANAR